MPLSVKALSYLAWAVAGVRVSAQTSPDLAPAALHGRLDRGASGDHIIDQRNVLTLSACRSDETTGMVDPAIGSIGSVLSPPQLRVAQPRPDPGFSPKHWPQGLRQ